MSKHKVLYFIQKSQPTNYERQVASHIEAAVSFRNVNLIKPDVTAENCDFVVGDVIPPQYQDKRNLSA